MAQMCKIHRAAFTGSEKYRIFCGIKLFLWHLDAKKEPKNHGIQRRWGCQKPASVMFAAQIINITIILRDKACFAFMQFVLQVKLQQKTVIGSIIGCNSNAAKSHFVI